MEKLDFSFVLTACQWTIFLNLVKYAKRPEKLLTHVDREHMDGLSGFLDLWQIMSFPQAVLNCQMK